MGQHFKAYSPARQSVACITYPQNYNLRYLRNVNGYPHEKISQMFDYIEQTMGAEFGEYLLVGDHNTIVYREGDETNPKHSVKVDKDLTNLIWY